MTQPDGKSRSFSYSLYLANLAQPNPGLSMTVQKDELDRDSQVWKSTRGDIIRTARKYSNGVADAWQLEHRRYERSAA